MYLSEFRDPGKTRGHTCSETPPFLGILQIKPVTQDRERKPEAPYQALSSSVPSAGTASRCSNMVACSCQAQDLGQQLPRCPTLDKQHFTDVTGHRCRKTFRRVTEGISKAERLSAKLCVRGLDGPSMVPADDLMFYLHCWGLRTSARTYRLDFLMVSVVIPPFLSL